MEKMRKRSRDPTPVWKMRHQGRRLKGCEKKRHHRINSLKLAD